MPPDQACKCVIGEEVVNISPTLVSEDILTPDDSIKVTYKSIGKLVEKTKSQKDKSLGAHYTEYSGIGEGTIFGQKLKNEPIVPRSHLHYAITHLERPREALSEDVLNKMMERNKAFKVPKPNEDAYAIQKAFRENTIPSSQMKPAKRSIFPRSVKYEIEYMKMVKQRAFAKSKVGKNQKQPTTPPKEDCLACPQPNIQGNRINPYKNIQIPAWFPQPPFWYDKSLASKDLPWPVGNIDDYSFEQAAFPSTNPTMMEELQIERPERYLPGEIYYNETPKRPLEDLTKTSGCSKDWVPKDSIFHTKFDPASIPKKPGLLDDVCERENLNKKSLAQVEQVSVPIPEDICKCDTKVSSLDRGWPVSNKCLKNVSCKCGKSVKKKKLPQESLKAECFKSTMSQHDKRPQSCECKAKENKRFDSQKDAKTQMPQRKPGIKKCGPCTQKWPGDPKYTQPWATERDAEFAKVGSPFRNEATRWYECNIPPNQLNPLCGRRDKKPFPNWGLSTI